MVRIGEGAEVRLGAVVIRDVPDGGDVSGNFARGHAGNMKRYLKGRAMRFDRDFARFAGAAITCTAPR